MKLRSLAYTKDSLVVVVSGTVERKLERSPGKLAVDITRSYTYLGSNSSGKLLMIGYGMINSGTLHT